MGCFQLVFNSNIVDKQLACVIWLFFLDPLSQLIMLHYKIYNVCCTNKYMMKHHRNQTSL